MPQVPRLTLLSLGPPHPHPPLTLLLFVFDQGAAGLAALLVWGGVHLKQRWRFSFRRYWHNRRWARQLREQQARATLYRDWLAAELAIEGTKDHAPEGTPPLPPPEEGHYDEELVRQALAGLRARRARADPREIMFALRADLVRNLGGICNPRLHDSVVVTPRVVTEYLDEVEAQLRFVATCKDRSLPLAERLAFMVETRHAHGRSALLLTGGGTMAIFHVGVVQALVEHRLLPRIIAGASGGAIVAATVCTRKHEDLISENFLNNQTKMIFGEDGRRFMPFDEVSLRNLVTKGAMHGAEQLRGELRRILGDLTFQEAFDISGRILNIVVVPNRKQKHDPPRLLNYLSAPNVVVWSAVSASCAFPGLLPAQELIAKDHTGAFVPWHGYSHDADAEEGRAASRGGGGYASSSGNDCGGGGVGGGAGKQQQRNGGAVSRLRRAIGSMGSLPNMLLAVGSGDSLGGSEDGVLGNGEAIKMANPRQWRDGSLERDLPMRELSEMLNVNFFIVSQTNPHVVHYLRMKKWFWRNARLLYNLAHFAECELKLVARTLLELQIVNDRVWLPLFSQPWEGDINIVLPASVRQVLRAQSNVTLPEYHEYVRAGSREAWGALAGIRTTCAIELALDECVTELKAERQRQRRAQRSMLAKRRSRGDGGIDSRESSMERDSPVSSPMAAAGRIPSWNCMRDAGGSGRMRIPKTASESSLSDRDSMDDHGAMAGTGTTYSTSPSAPVVSSAQPSAAAATAAAAAAAAAEPSDECGGEHETQDSASAVVSFWSQQHAGIAPERPSGLSWHAGGADDLKESLLLELAEEDPGALDDSPIIASAARSTAPASSAA